MSYDSDDDCQSQKSSYELDSDSESDIDADFRNKKFIQEDIEKYKYYFSSADLTGADFSKLNLTDADLRGAILTDANFTGAKLIGANLTGANLTGADLIEADLTGADLTQAVLSRADFRKANLTDAKLTKACLTEADFKEADITGADLKKADLRVARFTKANLTGAKLINANLINTNLVKANLAGADLTDAKLNGADLTEADLTQAVLTGANLTKAKLEGANLTKADLKEAYLRGAILTDADLTEAILTDADLTQANLERANLRGVRSSEIIGIPLQLPEGWKLINGCLREQKEQNKENLMKQLDEFNVNREHVLKERHIKITDIVEKQPTCFDVAQQDNYNINDFLLGKLEDDKGDEIEIARRLVFFVGTNQNNLQPFCYDLENLLNDLNATIYTTDCITNPRRLANPLFKLNFGYTVYVYLKDMIDVLTTTNKRVFVVLPRLKDDGTQEEIMNTATLNFIDPSYGHNPTFRGADHCQEGSNKKVYNIFACEGRNGEPCYPVEHVPVEQV